MQLAVKVRNLLQTLDNALLIALDFLFFVDVQPVERYAQQAGVTLNDGFVKD